MCHVIYSNKHLTEILWWTFCIKFRIQFEAVHTRQVILDYLFIHQRLNTLQIPSNYHFVAAATFSRDVCFDVAVARQDKQSLLTTQASSCSYPDFTDMHTLWGCDPI